MVFRRGAHRLLAAMVFAAAWLLNGCTTIVVAPVVVGEYEEHKRHAILMRPPLAPLAPVDSAPASPPDIVVERFAIAGETRRYFDELWLLPLLPWTDRTYPLVSGEPAPLGIDPVWIPLDEQLPPDEPAGPNYEAWRGNFLWRTSEKLARAPIPPGTEGVVRARLAADAGGALESRVARALRAASPRAAVATEYEAAPMKLAWRFRSAFDADEFARAACERQALSARSSPTRVALDDEDIVLLPEFDPAFARNAPVRIEGALVSADLEKRRHLWMLTMIGSDYLAVVGVPQSRSRYALELVLTARSSSGDILLSRTVDVRTRRGTASMWYGYGAMRDQLAAEFERRLDEELAAFARDVTAGTSIAAK